jgi:hypothetical protein
VRAGENANLAEKVVLGELVYIVDIPHEAFRLTNEELNAQARSTLLVLQAHFDSRYENFPIRLELVSAEHGCLKIKLLATGIALGSVLGIVAKYKDLRDSVGQIVDDVKIAVAYVRRPSTECKILFHSAKLSKELYGPVARGETVSGIVSAWDCGGTTLKQKIRATVLANPTAFVGGDPDRLREGVVLRMPLPDHFRQLKAN